MKRTTIMVEEETLYELQQIAQVRQQSTSRIIREALATYVAEVYKESPPDNPLLALVNLGASEETMHLGDGGDETLLRDGVDPKAGWRVDDDGDR